MYATDTEIESYYRNATFNVEFWDSLNQGQVEIEFPHAAESDYLDASMVNTFIIYEWNDKIAFDHWMPESLYLEICRAIRKERRKLQR